ncbi:MAG TPA: hypothetical protein VKE40_27855 [Gemmataceae bacterium]|nr:hypothetical protein [Gemmataceae bacterium]
MRSLFILGWVGVLVGGAAAQPPVQTEFATERTVIAVPGPVSASHAYTPDMLLKMPECELAEIYRKSPPAPVPCGFTPGLIIYKPGSLVTTPVARLSQVTAWQGKYFPPDGTTYNVTFGLPTVRATIYPGDSWFDGGPTTVFDYSETSFLFPRCRDEVREVSPGVYLGILYRRTRCGPKIRTWFALDARDRKGCCVGEK